MDAQISRGCLARIWKDGLNQGEVLVQALDMKPVGGGATPRLRMEVTDHENRARAMVGTQMCPLASSEVKPGRILKLQDYVVNVVSNKRVFIVLRFEVVGQAPVPQHTFPLLESTIRNEATQGMPQQSTNPYAQPAVLNQQSTKGQGFPPMPAQPPSFGSSAPSRNQQQAGFVSSEGQQTLQAGHASNRSGNMNYGQTTPPSAQASFGGYGQKPPTGIYGGNYQTSSNPSMPIQPRYESNQGPVARNNAPAQIVPIAHLNPYMNRWTIIGRCTSKTDLRRWSNARGEGKVFSFDLLDKEGGEIRATAFNEQAEDFEPIVEVGGVYSLTKGTLKPKRPQFNHTNHDFELSLERTSKLERVQEDSNTQKIPQLQFQIKEIQSIQEMEKGKIIDVVGVVERVDPWTMISKKNGEETSKRPLILRDKTNCEIELTLWGDSHAGKIGDLLNAEIDAGKNPIVGVKGARVGDFNGKNLSTISSTQLVPEPDIPEAHDLRQWYHGGGRQLVASCLSNQRSSGGNTKRIRCCDIPSQVNQGEGKPVYVEVVAPIVFIRRENMYYPACTKDFDGRSCNKKLREEGPTWFCDRCSCDSRPEWRYLLSLAVKDHTGMQYLTAFGAEGMQIMGRTADEVRELEGSDAFDEAINSAQFCTRKFVLKIFEDFYNDEARIKTTVIRQEALDPAKETMRLLGRISKYTGDKSLKSQSYGVTGGKMNMGQTYGNQYNLNSTHPGGQQSTYTAPSLGGRPFF